MAKSIKLCKAPAAGKPVQCHGCVYRIYKRCEDIKKDDSE